MTIKSIIEKNIKSIASSIKEELLSILGTLVNIVVYILLFIGNIATKIIVAIVNMIRPLIPKLTRLHHKIGSKFPVNIRKGLYKGIVYSGIRRNPEEILGIALMYSIIIPAVLFIFALILGAPLAVAIFVIIIPFVIIWIFLYMLLLLLIDRRTASIEAILPDVLAMISQNIIAGMTPYNALWVAARPEFGPLAAEIQDVARGTLAGASLEESLVAMTRRVRSEKLTRSVKLMIQGMKSGGELPTVLQEIANDMRVEQNLMRRMQAETTSQAMFILFALLVGAPFLFAASLQFITIFSTILGKVDLNLLMLQQAKGGMISLHPLSITPSFFMIYAMIVLALSSLFGSFLIGLIRTGKMTSGTIYVPILVALSVAIFLALNYGLSSFFRGMISV